MQQYNSRYGQRAYRPEPQDDSVWSRFISPNIVVFSIIVLCTVVFFMELVPVEGLGYLMMYPNWPMPWMFVTSIFLHAGFNHLFFNMFMLFMFGMTLERMLGSKRFLVLFLAAGIMGNIGYVVFCWVMGITDPAIGASGAIYGVFACLALLAPHIRVYLLFFLPLRIVHALLLYAAIDIVFLGSNDNIAHAAHLAGLVAGLLFAFYIREKLRQRQAYSVSYSFDADL